MSQLEPRRCPFCKSTNVDVIYDVKKDKRDIIKGGILVCHAGTKITFYYNVKCCKCGLTMDQTYRTRIMAVIAWNNTRHIAVPVWRRVYNIFSSKD